MTGGSPLSGITVVYLMAIGFQLFVILFIFAKRQIMRFARSSRKDPHAAIGSGCRNTVKFSIQGNMAAVASLDVIPPLTRHLSFSPQTSAYWYRLKTLDDLKLLDAELDHSRCPHRRKSMESLDVFLGRLQQSGLTFNGDSITRLCQLVESARYARSAYGEAEYREFIPLLNQILAVVKRNRHQLKKVGKADFSLISSSKSSENSSNRPQAVRSRLQKFLQRGGDQSEETLL